MSVFEGILILETVSDRSVHADVSQPDHGQRQIRTPTQKPQSRKQQNWGGVRVREVVSDRSGFVVDEVAQHRGVGRQKQQDKPQTTSVQLLVKEASCQQSSRSFKAQQA